MHRAAASSRLARVLTWSGVKGIEAQGRASLAFLFEPTLGEQERSSFQVVAFTGVSSNALSAAQVSTTRAVLELFGALTFLISAGSAFAYMVRCLQS